MCKALYQKLIQKVGIDKVAHFAVSAFITLAFGKFVHWVIAAIAAMALGIAKEYLDGRTGGSFDKKDLLADALGMLAGTLILII